MRKKCLLITIAVFAFFTGIGNPAEEAGKAIFISRCGACHSLQTLLIGPALAGVEKRRNINWITSFIRSSQTMIKNGEKDAVALYEKFNKIPMPDHADLKEDDIKSILAYIKEGGPLNAESTAPFSRPSKLRPAYTPLSISNYGFFISFLAIIGMLVAVLLFAVQTSQMLGHSKKDDEVFY